MTALKIRLVGPGGTIHLTDKAADYLRTQGGSGWGMAPVANSFFVGAGDGAVYRSTRRTQRIYTLPVIVFGSGRQKIEDRIRALTRVAREPFRIYADYPDGRSYWIEAIYDSGAAGDYNDSPEQYAELPFVFTCPDPYWTSVVMQSFTIESGVADQPLLPEFAELWIGPSAAIGSVQVSNVGDVPTNPSWRLTGPIGAGAAISINGQGFTFKPAIRGDEVITIQRVNNGWTISDQDGVNRYADLGPAPVFAALPAGTSTVNVTATEVTPASSVVCVFPERREVVY